MIYNLDYVTFYWIWTGDLLDKGLQLHLLETVLALDLKILALQIWITRSGLEHTLATNFDYDY